MTTAPFIYEVSEMDCREFRKLGKEDVFQWEIVGRCVAAALAIKAKYDAHKNWDGDGDYWFAPLPGKKEMIVIVRIGGNPFAGGHVVSPVELPWLNK